jgi:hypothetical protein
MVEITAVTPVETGGKASYFFKLLVNYTFVQYLYWGVDQKPRFLGKVGLVSFRVVLEWAILGWEKPTRICLEFDWGENRVDFYQITTLKHRF